MVIYYRWAVLLGVLGVTVVLGAAALRLRIDIHPDSQLPQEHPYIQALNDLHAYFGDKNLVVVGLWPHDRNVFTPAFLAKLDEVTTRLRGVPGANPALVQSLAAPQVKVISGNADGIDVERIMAEPPATQAEADAVRRRAFASDLYVGTLVTPDGSAAAVHASFELTPATPGYRELDVAVRDALGAADDGTFDWSLSGPVVFLSQMSVYAARMAFYFPLALAVIGLVHYHAFRTLQALFLPLLTALLSVLWALGLMGLLGVPLDPFNTTTPILILAVAAGHAVQVLKRFYEEYHRSGDVERALTDSLAHVGPVMVAAGSIAGLSFCSLVTFRTASIRTFGLFTGLGILSALAIELTIIPAVRAVLPAPKGREREREAAAHPYMDAFLRWAGRAAHPRGARVVFSGTALLLTACALFASRVTVDTSHKREFGVREPVRVGDARINESFAGTNTLVLLIEGESEGAMEEPAVLQAIDGLERRLEAEPGVGKALSYVDLVGQLHRAMSAGDTLATRLPARRALTTQYLFLYSLSGGAEDFDAILDPTHRVAKVRVLVHEDSTRYGEGLIALARDVVADTFPEGYRVRYSGTLASTAAATEAMVHGKLRNIAQIVAITFTIAALLLRSFLGGLFVILPLALTVAVNFGVMGLFGVPLDTITAAISAMAVGIGADYAVYFLFRTREELTRVVALEDALARALATSGKAILFVSSAIALGYATLCLSGFGLHVQLGALVALAMVVSSVGALVLLPAVVTYFRPAFLRSVAVRAPEATPEATMPGLDQPAVPR